MHAGARLGVVTGAGVALVVGLVVAGIITGERLGLAVFSPLAIDVVGGVAFCGEDKVLVASAG